MSVYTNMYPVNYYNYPGRSEILYDKIPNLIDYALAKAHTLQGVGCIVFDQRNVNYPNITEIRYVFNRFTEADLREASPFIPNSYSTILL